MKKSRGLIQNIGVHSGLIVAGLVASVLLLAFSLTAEVEQPHWEKQKLANSSIGFVELEAAGNSVHVAHRNNGVEYFRKQKGLFNRMTGNEWEQEKVDERKKAGSYISMDMIRGNPVIAYQYADIGEEEVKLAERGEANWTVSDNLAENAGLNVGMHSEVIGYRDSPLVFYTDDREEELTLAEAGEEIERQVVETATGLATDAETCREKVYVAYADRGSNQLNLGKYDGSWSSRKLNETATAIDLEFRESCEPLIVYHSDADDMVKTWSREETRQLEKSQFTRISADVDDGLELLYTRRNVGLRHQVVGQNDSLLEKNRDSGSYHDLELEDGNRYAAYTNGSELVYAEYNTSRPEMERNVLKGVQALSGLFLILGSFAAYRRELLPFEKLFDFLTQKL